MSALGQKQTFALQNGVSALPPKADIHERRHVPANGEKRTPPELYCDPSQRAVASV